MVIVDTTVWVDYLNDVATSEVEWLDRELPRQPLGLLDLMACEILQGLSTETEAASVLHELRRFEIFESGGLDLAVAAAANYRTLRTKGRTVRKTIDCLIATFCLRGDHSLLHCDRDFDPFEEVLGLRVVHPDACPPGPVTPDGDPPASFQYNWKTERRFASTCMELAVELNDGSVHGARFRFVR